MDIYKDLDNYECEGQMSIDDLFMPPKEIIAVSDVFVRARKEMNVDELKTFTYALTKIKWKEKGNNNIVFLEKKTLANILGMEADTDHLSQNLKRRIGQLRQHSGIEICLEDQDFWESGQFVTNIRMVRDNVRITFYEPYMALFENLGSDYLTMYSLDIFEMKTERSIIFYEKLRSLTDASKDVYEAAFGIKAFKEMFNIPKEGKGSYVKSNGHLNRQAFEEKVIMPLCEDLSKSKMITLIPNEKGEYFEKIKQGNRVLGYKFTWAYSKYPRVATAVEVRQVKEEIERDPKILKVANDLVKGEKKPKPKKKPANNFNNYENQRQYDYEELEKRLLGR